MIAILEQQAKVLSKDMLHWVSIGTFLPYVIYAAPILNEYLHNMSCKIYDGLCQLKNVSISKCYQPYNWLPHTTLGKKLTKEQMQKAFEVMQNQFGVFEGTVTKIGLAKTNPYRNVVLFDL